MRQGTLPVVLTVPHDGVFTSIDAVQLEYDPESRPRDMAVRILARDTHIHLLRDFKQTPGLVVETIHRKHRTPQVRSYFDSASLALLRDKSELYPNTNILLLDLHGFTKQPEFGEFDLILGTGNRKTVGESGADCKFADYMSKRGYEVYVPSVDMIEGELYGATKSRTLVQKMLKLGPKNAVGIQVEVARHFRRRGDTANGERLSKDLGGFIISWVNDSR